MFSSFTSNYNDDLQRSNLAKNHFSTAPLGVTKATMNHRLQCKCGALGGQVSETHRALRGVCYCKDCRAYSHHLGLASAIHDPLGGLEFVATQAKYVTLTAGVEHLACRSLSEKGLLRWYAKCCNTPIANTVRNWKFPYVGLIHTCLTADRASFERAFPRIQMRVNTGSALATPQSMHLKTLAALLAFMPQILAGTVSGAYRQTPFFNGADGAPAAEITVFSKSEREHAYSGA